MIDGLFVINPVVHAYNLTDANLRSPRYGPAFRETLWALHSVWNPPELQVSQAIYFSDWPVEVLADTLFLETSVDLAGHHRLRLDSWFHDGLVAHEKNVALRKRWPQRFLVYVGVDPTAGLERCLEELDRQQPLSERLRQPRDHHAVAPSRPAAVRGGLGQVRDVVAIEPAFRAGVEEANSDHLGSRETPKRRGMHGIMKRHGRPGG